MATNSTRNRHFHAMRQPHRKWDFYDAQPAAVRTWFQQFPSNVWPGDFQPVTPSMQADAERRHLAGLRAVWGDDHPAVLDASRRIAIRQRKIVELANADDLLSDF